MAQRKSKADKAAQKAEQMAADALRYRQMFATENFLFVPNAWETESSNRMKINSFKFARIRKDGLQFDIPYYISRRAGIPLVAMSANNSSESNPVTFKEEAEPAGEVTIEDLKIDLRGGFEITKKEEVEKITIYETKFNDGGVNYDISIAMDTESARFYIGTIREN